MDIYETRVWHLKNIIGPNQIKDFANAFDLDASYLSQLLNGHRRMGERAAATIEEKIGLPRGTFSLEGWPTGVFIYLANEYETAGLVWAPPEMRYYESDTITYIDDRTAVLSNREKARKALTFDEQVAADERDFQGTREHSSGYSGPREHATLSPEMKLKAGSVPVVGKALLGTDGYFEAMDYPVGTGDGRLMVPSNDPNAYALKVSGHSMMPRIKNGEFVLIEPNHGYVAGDEVLVKTFAGQAMIKEYIYTRDGEHRFDSVNPGVPPLMLPVESVEKIHYVAGILKPSRHIVDDH